MVVSRHLGPTPLHLAAKAGHADVASLLLAHGADVNARLHAGRGDSVLHLAAEGGDEAVVRLLIDKGAAFDVAGAGRGTALHRAADAGRLEAAKMLIAAGAKIDPRDGAESTPLHRAAYRGHTALAALLLENRAAIDAMTDLRFNDRGGCTAVVLAALEGHDETAKMLLARGAAVLRGRETLLELGTRIGDLDLMGRLLDPSLGIDLDAHYGGEYGSQNGVLHWVAMGGHASVVTLVLDRGADIELENRDGRHPLHLAAGAGHKGVVELLLARGAKRDEKGGSREMPLHLAAESEVTEVIPLLLGEGVDIDATCDMEKFIGYTALHLAITGGHTDTVKLLLDRGSDIALGNDYAPSVLFFVVDRTASVYPGDEILRLVLDRGAEVNAKNSDGMTPLHHAAEGGQAKAVEMLLAKGADRAARDGMGRTPADVTEDLRIRALLR